jgi:hypothetical protein
MRVAAVGTLDFLTRDNPFTSERARRELGWAPPVRPEVGIPDAFRWWKEDARRTRRSRDGASETRAARAEHAA